MGLYLNTDTDIWSTKDSDSERGITPLPLRVNKGRYDLFSNNVELHTSIACQFVLNKQPMSGSQPALQAERWWWERIATYSCCKVKLRNPF